MWSRMWRSWASLFASKAVSVAVARLEWIPSRKESAIIPRRTDCWSRGGVARS